jgi:hypothetical protein
MGKGGKGKLAQNAVEAYNLTEVGKMLGLCKETIQEIIDRTNADFPFTVIKVGRFYLIPKYQVDGFLKDGRVPAPKRVKGTLQRYDKNTHVTYNYYIPRVLDAKFDTIIKNMNKVLTSPLKKGEMLRIAIEEFVERRPEFMTEGD